MTKLLSQVVHGLRDDCALEDEDDGQRDVESDQRPDEQLRCRPTNSLVIDNVRNETDLSPYSELLVPLPSRPCKVLDVTRGSPQGRFLLDHGCWSGLAVALCSARRCPGLTR